MARKKTKRNFFSKHLLQLNTISISFIVIVAGGLLFLLSQFLTQQPQKSYADTVSLNKKVVGYYVYWDQSRGLSTIENNSDVFTEISPWAYTLNTSGGVILDPSGGANVVDATSLTYFRTHNMKVIPTIHNLVNGTWNNGNIVSNIINNSSLVQTHINNIVNLVMSQGYDGIDIDYENLNGSSDRIAYTNFITNLAAALHAQGKLLTVDVYGKTSEPGGWSGPQAQNYTALGQAADEVRIMLYDYNPATVGPIAPYSWIDSVLAFAITQISPSKVIQGTGLYAYDWINGSNAYPTTYMWVEATNTAQQYGSTIQWDSTNLAPWFTYTNNGTGHTVWFENNQSTGDKLDLTNKYNIAGVDFWRLGGEDPATWNVVRTKFGGVASPSATPTITASTTSTPTPTSTGDITPPTVQITAPKNGATVSGKVAVKATATDNVKVKNVKFFVDNSVVATDTSYPYGFTWATGNVARGAHTLTAIAVDTSGNSSAPSTITVYK